mgnify:CR=1 FL=1
MDSDGADGGYCRLHHPMNLLELTESGCQFTKNLFQSQFECFSRTGPIYRDKEVLCGVWVLSLSAGIGIFPVDWSLVDSALELGFLSHV